MHRPAVDRAEYFTLICRRNALRREAGLPLLDVRREVEHMASVAYWRAIYADHYASVEEEVLAELRARNPDWGDSAVGRLALRLLTAKRLRERFGPSAPPQANALRLVRKLI